MKFYAGIGSRETPQDVLDLMTLIAATQAMRGWTLRTGIALGADQAFALGAGPNAEWSLPWLSFEQAFQDAQLASFPPKPTILLPSRIEENVARQYHPAWDRLSQGAKKLHARNVLQVLGKGHAPSYEPIRFPNPSSFVVCWTKDGKASGGTGQAIRIAEAYGIPVRNLHDPKTREAAERFVKGEE